MILLFPSEEILRGFLRSGILNGKDIISPILVSDQWPLEVEFDLPRTFAKEIRLLGVKTFDTTPKELSRKPSWLHLVSLEESKIPSVGNFLVKASSNDAPNLLKAFIHLDCFNIEMVEVENQTWIKILNPPAYLVSLWEHLPWFWEQKPRLWVRLGLSCKDADLLSPKEDILISSDSVEHVNMTWTEVFQVVDIDLGLAERFENGRPERFSIPLRMIPWKDERLGTFWVADKKDQKEVEDWMSSITDSELQDVFFSSTNEHLLFSSPKPKTFPFTTTEYLHIPHFPNLFVERGYRMSPALSSARLEVLFPERQRTYWIDQSAKVRSIEESAFRPLSEWVFYMAEQSRPIIESWIQNSVFNFETSILKRKSKPKVSEVSDTPPPPSGPRTESARPRDVEEIPETMPVPVLKTEVISTFSKDPTVIGAELCRPENRGNPNLWLDAAKGYGETGDTRNAMLCFSRAVWLGADPTNGPSQLGVLARALNGEPVFSAKTIVEDPDLDVRSRWLLVEKSKDELLKQQVREAIYERLGSAADLPDFVRTHFATPETTKTLAKAHDLYEKVSKLDIRAPWFYHQAFAWAFARLGENGTSKKLLSLPTPSGILGSQWSKALEIRCHQAQSLLPLTAPLNLPLPELSPDRLSLLIYRWNRAKAFSRILESRERVYCWEATSIDPIHFTSLERFREHLRTSKNIQVSILAALAQRNKFDRPGAIGLCSTIRDCLVENRLSAEFCFSSLVGFCYQIQSLDIFTDPSWIITNLKTAEAWREFEFQLLACSDLLEDVGLADHVESWLNRTPGFNWQQQNTVALIRQEVFGTPMQEDVKRFALSYLRNLKQSQETKAELERYNLTIAKVLASFSFDELESCEQSILSQVGYLGKSDPANEYSITGYSLLESLLVAYVNENQLLSEGERAWIKEDEINLLRRMSL